MRGYPTKTPERVAEAIRLREDGWMYKDIAAHFGVGLTTVNSWITDPDGSQKAARIDSYRQPCPGCGTLMAGCRGQHAPRLCATCSPCDPVTRLNISEGQRARTDGITKADCLDAIRREARELGRTPTANGRDKANRHPSSPTIRNLFGSWNAAVVAAGLPLNWTSRSAGDPQIPTEYMLQGLREFAAEHPSMTYAEYERWARENGFPSGATVRHRFDGSWIAALQAAGVWAESSVAA